MCHIDVPLLEFDQGQVEKVRPADTAAGSIPDRVILCFFAEVIRDRCGQGRADVVHELEWEGFVSNAYAVEASRGRVAVVHPGVGAPLAAGILEELIALGGRYFMACGSAGSLVPELAMGRLVVPVSAVRDEGTSYHYLPASRFVEADPVALDVAVTNLNRHGVEHTTGSTWTTDAPFRETLDRIERRRREGCITVEMEAAALMAVAAHRGVSLGYYLYAGDDLSGAEWEPRGWRSSPVRQQLFDLAVEAVTSF
jgi:purine-nucleoside phosphorylase